MRNLRNKKHTRLKFGEDPAWQVTATAWDASDDSLLIAFGPNEDNPTITIKRLPHHLHDPSEAISIASWDAPSPDPELTVDRILDLHCFPDTKTLCLILVGGDIIVVREEPQSGEDLIEIVGSVDAGIRAAAWSPDEELLAVSTTANTLLFMTRDFESITNLTLSPEDLKVSNHVSVGWGKKETQFKGRGVAKTLRDPTVPEHVDEGTLSSSDDGRTSISWRGDGQYLAVNSILNIKPKRRVIRVYSREGTLKSVSEPVNGLEGALTWKPSGQLIAGVRRQDEKTDVVFFEKNGLRHGEFSLRLEKEEMATIGSSIELRWNVDSSVLAVSMKDRVQLWMMNNYHYYLKQEILLNSSGHRNANATWHPERSLQLCCWNGSTLSRLSYGFEVCRGSVTPPNDIGIVAVIDGKKLKVTPLRIANIPPPMAFDEIDLPDNALDVAVSESGTEIAVLHSDFVSIWNCDHASKPTSKAALASRVDLAPMALDALSPSSTDQSVKIPETNILYARIDCNRIYYHPSSEHDKVSDRRCFDPSGQGNILWQGLENQYILFFLSKAGILNVDSELQELRIPSCTSFVVTSFHLIYTTGQNLLKFVHLHGGELEIPADEPEKDERCRSIERGAKIVTVMPSAYSLVLQMPRGNLETIYPRALVLAGIRQSIRDRDYKKAFLICRTHRVDMNIIQDYAPEQFMSDVDLFVKQVKKVDYIDLFLSSLSEDDVSETLYRETLAPTEKPVANGDMNGNTTRPQASPGSKVNKICDAFLQVLHKQPSLRLQNIVTAHVCKNAPDLEAGLRLVSELRKQGDQERLEQAVEHICFLADVNSLYDTALGLYDLDVALLVAQQSQKDPREYLPYLQQLHDMRPLRQQFTVDDDLKRHQKALSHLHALEVFDELKLYMSKHELYAEAIELYRYDNMRLNELMRLYAEYLSSRNRYKEAGIAYEYISDHSSAYEAYRSVGMWRECLANAALVSLPESEFETLAQDLASSLQEAKNFEDAATIYLDHLNNLEGSARFLCKGHRFAEAMRQVATKQRPELLRSVVDPGLIEAAATMTELLAEMKSQLAAQVPRLRDLRQKKADDPMAFLDGADGGNGNIPDNMSLAPTDASTSGGTLMTRYTNRSVGTLATNATRKTSKNRRREERKRARGKKGTVYEEEYLVNSIARLIERWNEVGEDTTRLVDGLMRRSMRERAVAVQSAMDDVMVAVGDCMSEVFPPLSDENDAEHKVPSNEETLHRPWGGQGVLWDALTTTKQVAPVLKKFERLALIRDGLIYSI